MINYNIKRILFLILIPTIFIIHCSKYNELAPLHGDELFEYKYNNIIITFSVHSTDNNGFKITRTEHYRGLNDKTDELLVDKYGVVKKSTSNKYIGKYSPLWIPVNSMNIGDKFNDGFSILRKEKWKDWEVFVIKNPKINEERYFEATYGYFVGAKGKVNRNYELILTNTNAYLPKIN